MCICRRLRVPARILRGIITLLPFITRPSRIVSSSRKHQYECRCCGKSCMLSGQPVMMKSDNSASAGSTFVSSCRDPKRVDSTFSTCALLCLSQELLWWFRLASLNGTACQQVTRSWIQHTSLEGCKWKVAATFVGILLAPN